MENYKRLLVNHLYNKYYRLELIYFDIKKGSG